MISLSLMAIGGAMVGYVFGFKSGAETTIRYFRRNLTEDDLRRLVEKK